MNEHSGATPAVPSPWLPLHRNRCKQRLIRQSVVVAPPVPVDSHAREAIELLCAAALGLTVDADSIVSDWNDLDALRPRITPRDGRTRAPKTRRTPMASRPDQRLARRVIGFGTGHSVGMPSRRAM